MTCRPRASPKHLPQRLTDSANSKKFLRDCGIFQTLSKYFEDEQIWIRSEYAKYSENVPRGLHGVDFKELLAANGPEKLIDIRYVKVDQSWSYLTESVHDHILQEVWASDCTFTGRSLQYLGESAFEERRIGDDRSFYPTPSHQEHIWPFNRAEVDSEDTSNPRPWATGVVFSDPHPASQRGRL